MPTPAQARTALTLPSTLASVTRIEELACDFAARAGFDHDVTSNLAMIAREAAANAILHGNCSDPAKFVTATCTLTDEALILTVADQGEGLDVASVPDPLAPENLMRTSGRGIFLMRAFADAVHFRQLTPGTEITLIKQRTTLVASVPTHSSTGATPMSMKFKTRQVDGITILDLSGRITLGEGSVVLRDAVKDALGKGSKHILLNLADVDYIDSSGLGELVSAYTSAKNAGGEVKLLNLTKKAQDLLQITKLYTVFDVSDDETVAVSSFAK